MSDISARTCRASDKDAEGCPTLPRLARLPINRCNLPADILGGLTYQRHPTPLQIDGVADLHKPLWALLDDIPGDSERAQRFADYMESHFRLKQPEDAGLAAGQSGRRARASYLRVVRGWAFDSESREAAVLKGWVESRFGLCPRHHGEPLREPGSGAWQRYVEMRAQGLRGTNALESQLDLLYAYTQYELARQFPQRTHLRLYRGVNRLAEHETIQDHRQGEKVLLLNNINSFSRSRERAGEFGDDLLAVDVPLPKLAFFSQLLPDMLRGEDEYVVIGGLYRVRLARF
ncbi:MAG: NAD(+)--dinitrogen-reductase ADP-D-ribosyltransferase [Candidatus Accumulibacter sp.]|uniref:NAD(+)--dinitrogen-reductase ADP-D-ribosyltransferase n=1 Tax=Candidatus Accumulibacter affinis TaxID=2954384 RepID=A0A935TB27_9PROT|nr:NAD(+)--dinitrogen-reductase ADP-D-ribosyltransferase [Candidatus Accumulibacter affinis]